MCDAKEVEFSLKVMINKEKTKVLFAEVDSHFADILISFLTLPLGRIMKVLEKHYGDEAPTIGSLTTLYRSLANLDRVHFVTEGAKQTLLNPTSLFEDEYKRLKLDFIDPQPAEYFSSSFYSQSSNSTYKIGCSSSMSKEVAEKGDGVFTRNAASFIISDDLQIFPNETGLMRIISILGITDADKAKQIKVTFGLSEIMNLFKASLISQTPLSDFIFNKARQEYSVTVESMAETSLNQIAKSKSIITLKVVIQKSTGKLLYAQAGEDFVEFLFSFFKIPPGGAEHLLAGKTCVKAIDNLYRSATFVIDDKYFKTPRMKNRLIKPNLPHGFISINHTQECLPTPNGRGSYIEGVRSSSVEFPKGQRSYLEGPTSYKVTDDLTVTPFCTVSILSSLNSLKIPLSDVEEVEMQIGLKEALSILKASLTSTFAVTDAVLKLI